MTGSNEIQRLTVSPIEGEQRRFHVASQSRPLELLVDLDEFNGNGWCGCEDFEKRHWKNAREGRPGQCKHIKAAIDYETQKKNTEGRSPAPTPKTVGARTNPPQLQMEPEKRPAPERPDPEQHSQRLTIAAELVNRPCFRPSPPSIAAPVQDTPGRPVKLSP